MRWEIGVGHCVRLVPSGGGRSTRGRPGARGSLLPDVPSSFASQGLTRCASQGGTLELGGEEDPLISRVAPGEMGRDSEA